MIKRLGSLLLETSIVVVSVFIGHALAESAAIIPRWLIQLPEVTLTGADLEVISLYLGGISLLTFTATAWFSGTNTFAVPQRVAAAVYALIFAISLSALVLFFTTEINFDPETLLATALTAFALFVIAYLARATIESGISGFGRGVLQLIVAGITLPFRRPLVLLVLIVACLPIVTAKLFVADRDFANAVTSIRILLNAGSQQLPAQLVNAFPGIYFNQPMMVRFHPNDTGTMYVLDRKGRIFLLTDKAGDKQLHLDISDRVGYVEVENGALGFDLHPEFGAGNHHVFVYFTSVVKDVSQTNYLSRFDLGLTTVDERNASEVVLMELGRDTSGFHIGGTVEFGPDGMLYLAFGEASDVRSHQRIDRNLFGGILRIDVNRIGGDVSAPPTRQPEDGHTDGYYVPLDNPFMNVEGALGEFWALGLRNPFRMAFDPATAALWLGDVGSTKWEEVNVIRSGGNYQFPFIEGEEPTGIPRPEQLIGTEIGPVYHYIHTAYRRAVIGGSVYRGDRMPELVGQYVFADNYSGEIFALDPDSAEEVRVIARANQVAQRGVTSLLDGPDGEFYVTTLGAANQETGLVSRLVSVDYEPTREEIAEAPRTSEVASQEDAESLYNTNCARCHGRSGDGNTEDALALGVPMPDFTSAEYQAGTSDERIRLVIAEGGIAAGLSPLMPPWMAVMSQDEIEVLIDYVRELKSD